MPTTCSWQVHGKGSDLGPVGQGGGNVGKQAQLYEGGDVILPQEAPYPSVTLVPHADTCKLLTSQLLQTSRRLLLDCALLRCFRSG